MMGRARRLPEPSTRAENRGHGCSPDLVVAAGTGQLEERDVGTSEDRPRSISREPLCELLNPLSASAAHHEGVRRPGRGIVRISRHRVQTMLSSARIVVCADSLARHAPFSRAGAASPIRDAAVPERCASDTGRSKVGLTRQRPAAVTTVAVFWFRRATVPVIVRPSPRANSTAMPTENLASRVRFFADWMN